MANLGIVLPYTPLLHLLLDSDFPALVMTSANQTDEPICIDNDEACKRLRASRTTSCSTTATSWCAATTHRHERPGRA